MDLRDISINAMCEPYLHLDLNKVLKKKKETDRQCQGFSRPPPGDSLELTELSI